MNTKYQHSKDLYSYTHSVDDTPDSSQFKLHNHNDVHEILILLRGNCEFRVEGTVYYPAPGDIVIAHSSELHRVRHREPFEKYERIVINIHDSFFVKNGCEEFKKIFTARPLGVNNLIPGSILEKFHITDITNRLEAYIKEDSSAPEILIRSILIELLYILSRVSSVAEKQSHREGQINSIMIYINENITSPLSLDMIADRFFINKYHLCHMFKEQTGLTLNKYITYKRILLVRELCAQGKTLTEASGEAGFSNYSNFYKMYKKETGRSPKDDL